MLVEGNRLGLCSRKNWKAMRPSWWRMEVLGDGMFMVKMRKWGPRNGKIEELLEM